MDLDILREVRLYRQHVQRCHKRTIEQFVYYAREGYLDELKRMIEEGFKDIDECTDGFNGVNALMAAILKKRYSVIKYLISIGADVNHETSYGNSPLYYSWVIGDQKLREYLIKKNNQRMIKHNGVQRPQEAQ